MSKIRVDTAAAGSSGAPLNRCVIGSPTQYVQT